MSHVQLSLLEAETPTTPLLTNSRGKTENLTENGYSHKIYTVPSKDKHYFRYVVNTGHTVTESRYIPGGNINNPVAQKRAALVQEYIDRGVEPTDIIKLIETWRKGG